MLLCDYKNFITDTKSGAVMKIGGHTFDLSIEELKLCLWRGILVDPHPEKTPVLQRLAEHPAASVRLGAVRRGFLPESDLTKRLTDTSFAVRRVARAFLEEPAFRYTRPKDDPFFQPCGTLTYEGVTVPVFPDDFFDLFTEQPGGVPLMDTGTLAEALSDSAGWKAPEIREAVLSSPCINETVARRVMAEGTDEDRAYLLANPSVNAFDYISESELTELTRRSQAVFRAVMCSEDSPDKELQKRIAGKIQGELAFEPDGNDLERLDRILGAKREKPEIPEKTAEPQWSAQLTKGRETPADEMNAGDAAKSAGAAAPVELFWLGMTRNCEVGDAVGLALGFPGDVPGLQGTLMTALAAAAGTSEQKWITERLEKLKASGVQLPLFKAIARPFSAYLRIKGAVFEFDPDWVSPGMLKALFRSEELWKTVRERFAAGQTSLVRVSTERQILADDPDISREAAQFLAAETDDDVVAALCENTNFWNLLEPEETLSFVGNDPARQLAFMTETADSREIKSVCPAFLKSSDPEIRELAAKRLAHPGWLDLPDWMTELM